MAGQELAQEHGGHEAGSVLLSDKEAAELEELLQFFELGFGDGDQFAAALQEESAALEAANVYAILESGTLVEGVLGQLRHTQALLDDLDESLKVFDFKLRHMREDIAAIETSNNSLELQSRHNGSLLTLLDSLLAGLELDRSLLLQLEQPAFDTYKLPSVVAAAWQLHAACRRMSAPDSPGALSPLLCQMRVVGEARAHLQQIAARFVAKACNYIGALLHQLVAEAMSGAARSKDRRARVNAPDRQRLRSTLQRYQPLIQVVAVLEPRSLQQLQLQVVNEVHTLLKWELHAVSGELRRAAAADLSASSAAGEGNYALNLDRAVPNTSSSGSSRRAARVSYGSVASDSCSDATAEPLEFASAAASAGIGAAKRTAFLEGSAPGLPLNEAWSLLLDGFVPFLSDEAAFLADLLLMFRGDEQQLLEAMQQQSTAQGSQQPQQGDVVLISRPPDCLLTSSGIKAMELLLSGLDGDFAVLAELATQSHQVLMLPLLAVARAWQAWLQGQPHAAPLLALLADVSKRLQAQWSAFVRSEVALVEQYEAKSKMGLNQGIKNVHVLPFVRQFCLLAHDQEVALAEGLAAAAAGAGAAAAAAGAGAQQGEGTVLAAARTVRAEGDGLYQSLCPVLLGRLERFAASDPKYQERCRLENYSYLGEALRGLAPQLPVLQQHWQVAESRRQAALSSYVEEQLQYSKLWKLLEFADKVDKLLQVVSPPEVSFQPECSPAEVRSLMRSSMDAADKKLDALAARARKHLGGGALFNTVWTTIKQQLLARYEHLETLLEQCYPTMPLRPSPEELKELFRATSAG